LKRRHLGECGWVLAPTAESERKTLVGGTSLTGKGGDEMANAELSIIPPSQTGGRGNKMESGAHVPKGHPSHQSYGKATTTGGKEGHGRGRMLRP